MARYGRWGLIALAAGVVLVGPGIRDNAARAIFIVLGLAAIVFGYFRPVRRGHPEAGE